MPNDVDRNLKKKLNMFSRTNPNAQTYRSLVCNENSEAYNTMPDDSAGVKLSFLHPLMMQYR